MTAKGSDRTSEPAPGPVSDAPEGSDERALLSYEGSRIPGFVIIAWLAFFVWGVIYLVRWIPESWREWFSR